MVILGIESSCDETAAALVEDGRRILANVVSSQIAIHRPYGGVVPELASRQHLKVIIPVVREALAKADKALADVDALAVTRGPGLVGSLLVGIGVAKGMAYATGKPLVAVNHLEGHIQAAFLEKQPPRFPLVALVVSGGHTNLYHLENYAKCRLVGRTRDDAAGEAFDKVAKFLGLGYPGGIVIDKLSQSGNPAAVDFPRAYLEKDSLDFSFSGLKTAVVNLVRRYSNSGSGADEQSERTVISLESLPLNVADIVASFQEAVVDILVHKTIRAARNLAVHEIVVAGGVAANSRLRQKMQEEASALGLGVRLPEPALCTDNAAMIAAVAYHRILPGGHKWDLDFDAISRWPDG
ncbi:MAG: tRNA (adenosine(37)-N6)-threonylcarbamoyltransferase complex transferase subunit TsaD [Deltaproteobacteria bacterium]|nr:tRNA (adenosine(37)-N6)-threonylcarbamoyltransferase complex transferase subunit TsaD [Deltaproteobacteria bacterium]